MIIFLVVLRYFGRQFLRNKNKPSPNSAVAKRSIRKPYWTIEFHFITEQGKIIEWLLVDVFFGPHNLCLASKTLKFIQTFMIFLRTSCYI
jgi:hypothetical protein